MIFFDISLFLIILLLIFVKTKKQTSALFWFACTVSLLFLFFSIKNIFNNIDIAGHDFHAYYHASHDYKIGNNPYTESGFLQYRYFPITLYLFRIFTIWDYSHSLLIYTLLKIFVFCITILIWMIYGFKDNKTNTILILVGVFGFYQAALIDFNTGNITTFEFFYFTIALIFLLRNKVILYCAVIIFLSLFKMQLIPLIFIPLINFNKKNLYITVSSLIFCIILFLSYYFIQPEILKAYISQINAAMDERGLYSPNFGVLQLINTFIIKRISPFIEFRYLNYLIYSIWLLLVSIITFLIFKKSKSKVTLMILINYLIIVYALTVPRLMNYSLMLLIIPAVFVIHYCISYKVVTSAVILLVCWNFGGYYQPIISVYILFLIYLIFFYRISAGKVTLDSKLLVSDIKNNWFKGDIKNNLMKKQNFLFKSVTVSLILILCVVYFILPKTDYYTYSKPLSKNELKVSNYLANLRKDYLINQNPEFISADNFHEKKKFIDTSRIFKIFKKMPKGALLHIHSFAGSSAEWIVKNLTYMDNCYLYTFNDSVKNYGTMMFLEKDSYKPGWESIKDLRENSRITDDSLINMLTLNYKGDDSKETLIHFENIIDRLSLIYYEPAFRLYSKTLFDSLITDGESYAELRTGLSGVYDLKDRKYTSEDILLIYKEIIDEVKIRHPEFDAKIIFTVSREINSENFFNELNTAQSLRRKYPDLIAGIDISPYDNHLRKISNFKDKFHAIDSVLNKNVNELPFYISINEFENPSFEYIESALRLNPKRIGYGLGIKQYPDLALEVKEKQIAIEVCPLSNLLLGQIPDLSIHPAAEYILENYPLTLNSDYPQIFGYSGLTYDFLTAYIVWGFDLPAVKKLAENSLSFSGMDEEDKKEAVELFNRKWNVFIDELANSIPEK